MHLSKDYVFTFERKNPLISELQDVLYPQRVALQAGAHTLTLKEDALRKCFSLALTRLYSGTENSFWKGWQQLFLAQENTFIRAENSILKGKKIK